MSHCCGISKQGALSHTAIPLESRSWELLLFQLLESSSQPPGPGECVCRILSLRQMQWEGQEGHLFPRELRWWWVFLNHEVEQKPCCTLNVTARQKEESWIFNNLPNIMIFKHKMNIHWKKHYSCDCLSEAINKCSVTCPSAVSPVWGLLGVSSILLLSRRSAYCLLHC